jgi:tetratricopeptide (TPR) repeat protein/tRNA A-37 threonylcarbamoyl transferase component Bud32
MTPDQWRQVKAIFHDALEQPEAARAPFVERADVILEVRSEVQRLLHQHAAARTFLETPAAAADPSLLDASPPATNRDEPVSIGPYVVLGIVGEGGMGVVYLAEQDSPRRRVALKVVRPGMASEALLRRFEHEAQALARLQHPGIAQIYQAGTDGVGLRRRPYFAMELVEGRPLPVYADEHKLGARDRIALFILVCEAVQHAHMKGVIHRDLKPGNIIVGADGQPKVLDFGVARVTDSDIRAATVQTDVGQLVGTVPYMSPEQIAGQTQELDTRSDVYSLGVVLFELLTGRLPYDLENKSIIEAARLIREQPPTRLSVAVRSLRGDLDVILGKALEKDRHRRYQSAAELGVDLGRYLRREPISARPPSALYQMGRFASRHRALVAGAAAVLLVLVAGLLGVLQQRNVAQREAHRATTINEFFMDMLKAANPERLHGREMTVKELLDEAAEKLASKPSGNALIDEEIRVTLGQTYWLLGALDKSEPLLRAGAERAEAATGKDNPITLTALTTLSLVLSTTGRSDEAGPMLERVYQVELRRLGERNTETLSAMNNWARWLDAHGRQDEALALLQRVARLRAEVLGADDRKTLISVDNVGKAFMNRGNLDEAEKYLMQANEGFRRTLGEDDPDTLVSYQNLAELMRKRNDYPKAEEFARLAAEGRRRVLGMDDRFTLYSINTHGRILMDQRRAAEAEPMLKEAYEGIRRVARSSEPFAVGWGVAYARCLIALRRFEDAEALLKDCDAALPAVSGNTAAAARNLAEAFVKLYTDWDRPQDAAPWQARLSPVSDK